MNHPSANTVLGKRSHSRMDKPSLQNLAQDILTTIGTEYLDPKDFNSLLITNKNGFKQSRVLELTIGKERPQELFWKIRNFPAVEILTWNYDWQVNSKEPIVLNTDALWKQLVGAWPQLKELRVICGDSLMAEIFATEMAKYSVDIRENYPLLKKFYCSSLVISNKPGWSMFTGLARHKKDWFHVGNLALNFGMTFNLSADEFGSRWKNYYEPKKMSKGIVPHGMTCLKLKNYKHLVTRDMLPNQLTELVLDDYRLHTPVQSGAFPPGLTHLTLGPAFWLDIDEEEYQKLDQIDLHHWVPGGLTHLSLLFGDIDKAIPWLPNSLTHLSLLLVSTKEVGWLPISLTHLKIEIEVDDGKSLTDVMNKQLLVNLPFLTHLYLGTGESPRVAFSSEQERVTSFGELDSRFLPASLTHLYLDTYSSHSPRCLPHLKVVAFRDSGAKLKELFYNVKNPFHPSTD